MKDAVSRLQASLGTADRKLGHYREAIRHHEQTRALLTYNAEHDVGDPAQGGGRENHLRRVAMMDAALANGADRIKYWTDHRAEVLGKLKTARQEALLNTTAMTRQIAVPEPSNDPV